MCVCVCVCASGVCVEVAPGTSPHRDAGGRVAVAGQQREDVVGAVVAAAADERQVGRVGATVGVARGL